MNSWYFFPLQMSFFASKSVSDLLFKGWTISTAGGKQCFSQNSLSQKTHLDVCLAIFLAMLWQKNPNYLWQKCCLHEVKHFAASDPDAKYQLLKFVLAQRVKFGEIVLGYHLFLPPPLLLLFFPDFFHYFISFYYRWASLSSVEKDVGKTLRFDYRIKCRWKAVEIDGWGNLGNFQVHLSQFLGSSCACFIGCGLKDLSPQHKLDVKVVHDSQNYDITSYKGHGFTRVITDS